MDVFILIGILAFVFRFAYVISGLLFLWWRKEYRWDRMLIHLKTPQGKSTLIGKTNILFLLLLALWFVPVLRDWITVVLSACVAVLAVAYIRKFSQWFLPPISPKVVVLCVSLCIAISVAVMVLPFPEIISLAVADLLLFPVSALLVAAMGIPTRIVHRMRIRQAVMRLRSHAPMTVVGVTGSYGKTSVKEYLSAILESRMRTLKTEASKNSPIGIAETVLRLLTPEHAAFVVEMGAYKPGEIRDMAGMVRPEVGIVTAINPQHQDLFGSLERTMQAKYELLAGLTGKRIAIVNLDDARTRDMGAWAKRDGCEVWGWTIAGGGKTIGEAGYARIFRASGITHSLSGISFRAAMGNTRAAVNAPVLGAHQAGNILAAIAGAVACGVSFSDAAAAAGKIRPAKKVMQVVRDADGVTLIDDTFNNNPDAAKAAIAFLKQAKGEKILVFQPMIELGAYAEQSHEDVGRFAAGICDAVILTGRSHEPAFTRGVRSVSQHLPVYVLTPENAAAYIRAQQEKGHVTVLFKGKDAEHALALLLR